MIDKDQKEYDLYFSTLRGEHSTFKIGKLFNKSERFFIIVTKLVLACRFS
jgi:hypothetical protein